MSCTWRVCFVGWLLLSCVPLQAASTYPLHIDPTPASAEIKLLNIKSAFRQGISLAPGRYEAQVSKTGYQTRRFWIEISHRSRRILVTLQPDKSTRAGKPRSENPRLFITTEPSQAQVVITHIKPKFQPGMRLAPGTYEIEVRHPGFVTQRKKLTLNTQDVRVQIKLAAEDSLEQLLRQPPESSSKSITAAPLSSAPIASPRYALFVTTTPSTAEIQLLNAPVPFSQGMLLAPGAYQLKVSKKGIPRACCGQNSSSKICA